MYETFEHTADLGLRVRAADLGTLFAEAARCLFSAVVEDLDDVKPVQSVEVTLEGDDLEYLLFDWLNELLYKCDAEHLLLSQFEVKVDSAQSPRIAVRGLARGEPLDRTRHRLSHEVKAITYHGLMVEKSADGWLAEVIVDI